MASSTILCCLFFTFLLFTVANSTTFTILNQCSYTVWAAAIPGGGKELASGKSWVVNVPAGTTGGRIWGRTGCKFDSNGNGTCQTGDCNGKLVCTGYGSPPNTMAEFSLNQFQDMDFIDISLVDGFNVPMDFLPISNGCTESIHCDVDINAKCPSQLKTTGGCLNPCQVYKTDEYCCTSASGNCGPTTYSKFFKNLCPNAYSYPKDDATSTFTCKGGTNYQVIFCHRALVQAQLVYCSSFTSI